MRVKPSERRAVHASRGSPLVRARVEHSAELWISSRIAAVSVRTTAPTGTGLTVRGGGTGRRGQRWDGLTAGVTAP